MGIRRNNSLEARKAANETVSDDFLTLLNLVSGMEMQQQQHSTGESVAITSFRPAAAAAATTIIVMVQTHHHHHNHQEERGNGRALKRATNNIIDDLSPGKKGVFDLAADEVTGSYSGAELVGLVRCAGSISLSRARKDGAGVEALLITLDDIEQALTEVKV
jgi:SpoVK/Ycf46/Vps4 family AAA+-type ATPase